MESTETERKDLYDLFMQAPAIIAVLKGPDYLFELANPRYMQLIGVNREILGKPILEALPELQGQGFAELLDNVYKTGRPFIGYEVPAKLDKNEDGNLEEVLLNFVYQPAFDENGNVYSILVHAVDVTEQVKSRKRIEESEEKYRSLFTSMDQGFCIIEVIFDSENSPIDYQFLEINPMFELQTGLKNAEGKTARELLPDLEKRWFEIYGKVAMTGEAHRFIDGSEVMGRWFEVFAFRLGGQGSRKVAILFTDITDRRRGEENLKIKNEQLTRINNDLDNFIYTASHDLKAPINNIEGLINALNKTITEESRNNDKVKNLVGMIHKSIDRFKNTIKDLTEVAKVQNNLEEELSEVSFKEMVEEVKMNIKGLLDESNATVHEDFSHAPVIYFSKKNLRSILYNLISNAIKYRSPHRPVTIKINTSRRGDHILLSVEDNGLGVKEQDKSKVFTMFKRLHNHVEGTGVGLSIVKKIVDNNGGKIEIESEVDKGSIFNIYLKSYANRV